MNRRTFIKRTAILLLLGAAAGGLWRRSLPFGNGKSGRTSQTGEGASPEFPLQASPDSKLTVIGKQDDGATLSFVILSDLHVNGLNPDPGEHLQETFEDVLGFDTKVEALLITGDLTEAATRADYAALKSIVDRYKLPPIYANMGDREYSDGTKDDQEETVTEGNADAQSRDTFMRLMGVETPYYSVTINGYLILLLSQETNGELKPEVKEGAAWYSDAQLRWLKDMLADNAGNKPVFVMLHQPLPPQGQDGGAQQVIRAKAFRELLLPYPNVFVFYGHNHQDFRNGKPHYFKESFHLFNNSSVGQVLNRNREHKDKEAAQGLYVQVYPRKVVIRGRDFVNRSWLEEAYWTIALTRKRT